ncbi:MAG TPA: GNAT family N-acetyltransferase [Actinomycetota bacterium]|nr:GNAT family N-acetyltransferase [Actinomycetota bacterium]
MTPRIRPATLEDVDELARLRWEFRVEAGTAVTASFDGFLEGFRGFATDVLAGDAWRAWVAEGDAGGLVGCAWLQLVEKVPHPSRTRWERPVGYVTNMYVEPAARDAGLGRALLDALVAHARERGVDGLMLWPSERSTPFYRRAGFGREGWLWLGVEGD